MTHPFAIKGYRFSSSYLLSTIAGIIAILLWSTNIAYSKSIMEKEGIYHAGFYIYFFSGICNLIILLFFFKKEVEVATNESAGVGQNGFTV